MKRESKDYVQPGVTCKGHRVVVKGEFEPERPVSLAFAVLSPQKGKLVGGLDCLLGFRLVGLVVTTSPTSSTESATLECLTYRFRLSYLSSPALA